VPTPGPLHHFQCYEVDRKAFPQRTVTLLDQFSTSTAHISRMKRFCNPADKNGEDPSAIGAPDHLSGYEINAESPHFAFIRNYHVVDQFTGAGGISVDVVRPELVMVPSAKSLTAPPGTTVPGIDHFQCYRVKLARLRRRGDVVTDQFGAIKPPASLTLDVLRPLRLCVPVVKDGGGPLLDPTDQLMCYQIRQTQTPKFKGGPGPLFIDNQFGPDTIRVTRPTELCVPSRIVGPTCGDGIVNGTEACDPPGTPCTAGGVCANDCQCVASTTATPVETPVETVTPVETSSPEATPGCGNNLIDAGEDCDPPGSSCPVTGDCQQDCTCPPID